MTSIWYYYVRMLEFLLDTLIPYLLLYKYVTIFLIAFVAAFVVPIPSGSILMAAGAFAHVGYFNIFYIIIISIVGNILGDNLGYWMARKYGENVLSKIGFGRIIRSNTFKSIENLFNKRPGFVILISRFEVLSTLSVNLLSGLSKTPYKKYFIHESIGTVLQVSFYGMMGFLFADNWEQIGTTIGKITFIVGAITILTVILFSKRIIKRMLK